MSTSSALRILRRQPMTHVVGDRRAVLVHGTMDRATSFTRLMARLRDWSIVTYDRRGYAGSADMGPPLSFDEQVGDLIAVLDGHPAVAFGHSFGGDVVLAAAAAHPEVIPAALVWEPPQPWYPWWPDLKAGPESDADVDPAERAERFMRRTLGDRVWERLPSSTRAQRRAEGQTLQAEIACLTGGPAFNASAVRIPVIVGCGGRSSPYQRRSAAALTAALPNGQLAVVAEAGHGAHLHHPSHVAALLERAANLASRPMPAGLAGQLRRTMRP